MCIRDRADTVRALIAVDYCWDEIKAAGQKMCIRDRDQVVVETTASLSTLDKKFADASPITVDDNAVCIYRMSGGAVGTMTAISS